MLNKILSFLKDVIVSLVCKKNDNYIPTDKDIEDDTLNGPQPVVPPTASKPDSVVNKPITNPLPSIKDDIVSNIETVKPIEKPTETEKVETDLLVLLDNGHGIDTSGKHSPDKSLYEWKWNREMVQLIKTKLDKLGIANVVVVPGDKDVSLSQRCKIINEYCAKRGAAKCLAISVHINAAGSEAKWLNARGWSGWVAPKSSDKSKKFAQMLYSYAKKYKLQGNRSVPAEEYWIGNFAMVRDTKCPAVLTENLFQDNKEDVAFLQSAKGKEILADLHVNAIKDYIKYYKI